MRNKPGMWLIILLSTAFSAGAQPRYKSGLSDVPKEGFYAIPLPVGIIGKTRPDFSDLRIMTGKGEETAYILKKERFSRYLNEFVPYSMVQKTSAGKKTNIEIDTRGEKVSSFILNIKNADTQKQGSLKGSNDRREWYSVKEEVRLSALYNSSATHTFLKLDFPLSDYQYYLLSIDDSLSAPLNIQEIGKVDFRTVILNHQLEIPAEDTRITTEGGNTAITISYKEKYNISDVLFYISEPPFYNRDITICAPTAIVPQRHARKKRKEIISPDYQYHTLNSNDTSSLTVRCDYYTDSIRIVIFNRNNSPLKIDSIRTYTDKYYIVSWLKDSTDYYLTYGDENITRPVYDLNLFTGSIPEQPAQLFVGSTEVLYTDSAVQDNGIMLLIKKYGIWTVIILVIIQIMYMVWKMTRKADTP